MRGWVIGVLLVIRMLFAGGVQPQPPAASKHALQLGQVAVVYDQHTEQLARRIQRQTGGRLVAATATKHRDWRQYDTVLVGGTTRLHSGGAARVLRFGYGGNGQHNRLAIRPDADWHQRGMAITQWLAAL